MPTFNQLVTDSFARTTLGSNWTLTQPAFGVLVDTASGDGGAHGQYGEQPLPADHAWAWWSGAIVGLTDDQYVSVKTPQWIGFAATAGVGCALQVGPGSSRTGYELYVISLTGAASLYKWVGGARTLLAGPVTLGLAAHDTLTLAMTGGALTAHINGGVAIAGLSATDSSPLTGGRPGLTAANGPRVNDWYAGNSVAASSDTTEPIQAGAITIGTVTSSSIQYSWPAGNDNVAVVGYDVSRDGGATWTQLGNVLTHTWTGLTASTPYQLRVRPRDAAGNVDSTPLAASQATSAAASTATITVPGLAAWTGTVQAALTVPHLVVVRRSDRVQVLALTGLVTNGSGDLVITDAALSAGVGYMVLGFTADGSSSFRRAVTAA